MANKQDKTIEDLKGAGKYCNRCGKLLGLVHPVEAGSEEERLLREFATLINNFGVSTNIGEILWRWIEAQIKQAKEREREKVVTAIKDKMNYKIAGVKAHIPTVMVEKYIDDAVEQLKN